jgi:hypothetical protein
MNCTLKGDRARSLREPGIQRKINFMTSELDKLGKLLDVTGLQRVHSVVGVKCFSRRRLVTLLIKTPCTSMSSYTASTTTTLRNTSLSTENFRLMVFKLRSARVFT